MKLVKHLDLRINLQKILGADENTFKVTRQGCSRQHQLVGLLEDQRSQCLQHIDFKREKKSTIYLKFQNVLVISSKTASRAQPRT